MKNIIEITKKYFSKDEQILNSIADMLLDVPEIPEAEQPKQLTTKEREEIFFNEVTRGEAHEMRRSYLESQLREKTKIYFELKNETNPLLEIVKEKINREFVKAKRNYEYHCDLDKKEIKLDIERAKQRLISDFIQFKSNFAHCPFHKETQPSLKYYPETNTFNCFGGCGGGDVITFIMKKENLDFIRAVKYLI